MEFMVEVLKLQLEARFMKSEYVFILKITHH